MKVLKWPRKVARKTTNHMGNALDLQFRKGNAKRRCEGTDIEYLREQVFMKRLNAVMNREKPNTPSLELASQGATAWVHIDLRGYDPAYKADRYYATTQAAADGDSLMEIAKREGRLKLVNCGGIPPKEAPPASDRKALNTLGLSAAGLDFIQGWERFDEKPYDDSEGYCTIGYGHLIARKKCAVFAKENNAQYLNYKDGITKEVAIHDLKIDVDAAIERVKECCQVPLYQHEFDALVSLAFNTGSISRFPKLLSYLNTKNYSGCCDEFADITNQGQRGLVKRRQAEMKMYRNNVYDWSH